MTDLSNPDLVEQLAEKYGKTISAIGEFILGCRLEDDGSDPHHSEIVAPYNEGIAGVLMCLNDPEDNGAIRLALDEFVREAISVTRRETLEQNARIADTWKLLLPGVTLDVDPEEAGNQVADAIAAEIRRIGENK